MYTRLRLGIMRMFVAATHRVQPAMIEHLEQNAIPLGRLGTPEEAADGVYLFCSPESNYISGQVVTVGGGITFSTRTVIWCCGS